jgi:hypothetical protein
MSRKGPHVTNFASAANVSVIHWADTWTNESDGPWSEAGITRVIIQDETTEESAVLRYFSELTRRSHILNTGAPKFFLSYSHTCGTPFRSLLVVVVIRSTRSRCGRSSPCMNPCAGLLPMPQVQIDDWTRLNYICAAQPPPRNLKRRAGAVGPARQVHTLTEHVNTSRRCILPCARDFWFRPRRPQHLAISRMSTHGCVLIREARASCDTFWLEELDISGLLVTGKSVYMWRLGVEALLLHLISFRSISLY